MRNMFTVRHATYKLRGRTTNYGLHSFSCFSAQQWNDLPGELRNCIFNDFKRCVQSLNTFDKLSLIFVLFCVYFFQFFRDLNLFLEDISYIV